MDVLTKRQRSYCMSQIGSKSTKIEIAFRKLLWNKGYRNYRLHPKKIFGKPDLFFPKKRLAVFIDGCFWHKCPKCFIGPKSNKKYWNPKIKRNVERGKEISKKLRKDKIKVIRFWEHEVKKDIVRCYNKFKKIYGSKI